MARKRSSAPKRQTKINFSPSAKSSTAQTTPTKAKSSKTAKSKKQSKLDLHNIAPTDTPKKASRQALASDSSEDELQVEQGRNMLPVRAKTNGTFGSSDADSAEGSTSEAEGGAEKLVEKPATRASRKRQRAGSSDDEGTATIVRKKRARQAGSDEDETEELRVPGKRRRVERRVETPEESEEEPTPPRSVRRRLTSRPSTPDNDEEEEQTLPRTTKRRTRRQQASSDEEEEDGPEDGGEAGSDDAEEQEELKEELAFLRSSPLPDRGRLRSTQGRPKNKRQEALEALKRRRAGSTQEPSSTPARKTRTVVESDSESELEIIKEEPDSEVGDPESAVEDDDEDEDDREANALDMFQEDEDDTGFIDDDPDAIIGEPDDDQAQLPMQFSSMSRAKPKELFKYAVEWMVMKKIHPAFNPNDEIYELTFRKLGDEVKGLASSKFTSAAWTSDFTKAINARPELIINEIGGARREILTDHCEACNRKNHPATFELSLTGEPYNPESLEPLSSSDSDSDSDSDNSSSSLSASETHLNGEKPTRDFRGDRIPPASKTFTLGSTCKANAQVAHTLHHWRYHLNDWVKGWLESNGYLTPEKLVKRDKKSDRRREKEARKIVDEMERIGEIKKLQRLYKDQVQFAVEAVNDFKRGWGRR